MDTKIFKITSHNKTFYCAINKFGDNYTVSIGSLSKKCMIVSFNKKNPKIGYIDRIESDENCSVNPPLDVYKLVSAALWFIKQNMIIDKFTLIDDSAIYCEKKSKEYKLPLSYDYILKYNQTWYEKKFHARLPDLMMLEYKKSLEVLDAPLESFDFQKNRAPFLTPYEKEYKESSTPREFIQCIRNGLVFDTYCRKVAQWLGRYMELILRVKLQKEYWEIPVEAITEPLGYSSIEMHPSEVQIGGTKTRKANKKTKYRIGPDITPYNEEPVIGIYNENDEY